MKNPPRYAKELAGASLEYVGPGVDTPDTASFELQVSLGDMELDDAFRVSLPPRAGRLTIGDLLDEVFPEDEADLAETLPPLDIRANPDSPDMYDELLDVFDQWRRGDCTLRFFSNHGPELDLFRVVGDHFSLRREAGHDPAASAVLDLVIEQSHDVLARFAELGGDKAALIEWLSGSVLLYFMDKHGFRLDVPPRDELDGRLSPIADSLTARGLIASSEESNAHEITPEGRQFIGQMIAETESYIDRYGVFEDVSYELDAGTVKFGTGHGEDLRVQVYESEGMDPIRAVFLLRLYDETLDGYADSWREEVHEEGFFDEVLRPVLDHRSVDDDLVGWIIESGFAHDEETVEKAGRLAWQQETLKRIGTEKDSSATEGES